MRKPSLKDFFKKYFLLQYFTRGYDTMRLGDEKVEIQYMRVLGLEPYTWN